MPKYLVYNPGPNVAKEVKPGLGIFEIPPAGSIVVESKKLADSLVVDSGGHLSYTVIEESTKELFLEKKELPKKELGFFGSDSK